MVAPGNVIVFGPTGNIASVTAIVAQELGSKVYLAMRDPGKVIPGLSANQEVTGGFVRVQADLSQPDSVTAAVREAGAKRAFLNLVHGSPDHMKSTFQALKSAGVELVVFLSSSSVTEPLEDVTPSALIPYVHARAEISLREVFSPDGFVAVRPGMFATNGPNWWKVGFSGGDDVKAAFPDARFDWITPLDMGRVSGSILANGQKGGENVVYQYGPGVLSVRDAFGIVAKALGKSSIKVTEVSEQEAIELWKSFLPEPLAKYLVASLGKTSARPDKFPEFPSYKEGVDAIGKYSEKPGLKFEEWVQENKQLFVQ